MYTTSSPPWLGDHGNDMNRKKNTSEVQTAWCPYVQAELCTNQISENANGKQVLVSPTPADSVGEMWCGRVAGGEVAGQHSVAAEN